MYYATFLLRRRHVALLRVCAVVVAVGCGSKNSSIHECCYEYIRTILANFDTELMEKQSKAIAGTIKVCLAVTASSLQMWATGPGAIGIYVFFCPFDRWWLSVRSFTAFACLGFPWLVRVAWTTRHKRPVPMRDSAFPTCACTFPSWRRG